MLNQRTAAIAIHRIGIRFACALLLIERVECGRRRRRRITTANTTQEVTTGSDCISEFRQSAAGDSGCELETVTVDGNTCTLTGSCQADDGGWDSFNYDANIDDVDALQNCDGELRAECSE